MEGILYDAVENRMEHKEKEYKKLPLQSVEQIYASIEANLPDEYIYNENTKIVIIDAHGEQTDVMQIPESELQILNELHPMARGTYIYDLWKLKINSQNREHV